MPKISEVFGVEACRSGITILIFFGMKIVCTIYFLELGKML